MAEFISSFGKIVGCLLAGQLLKRSDLCNNLDAEIGLKFVQVICLPCLVIQVLKQASLQSIIYTTPMLVAPLLLSLLSTATTLLFFKNRYSRERALVVGFGSSVESVLLAYPIVYSIFGLQGLLHAVTFTVGQLCIGNFVAFLALRSGGTVFPAKYAHDDGGIYSGEWKGRMKNGIGRYKYPNGAVYEGQWFENCKQGYGVYKYSNGGQYKGQWFANNPQGIGIRVYSSGKVKQGLWQQGKLVQPLQYNECYTFADAAQSTVDAIKQMKLGMPAVSDGILSSILSPSVIAYLVTVAFIVCNIPLPSLINAASEALAIIGIPLGLIALVLCQPNLVHTSLQSNKDVMLALGIKFGIPIMCALVAVTLVQISLLPKVIAIGVAVAMICGLGPIQHTHLQMGQEYRLNGLLMQNLYSFSIYVSIIISAILAFTMWIGNLDAMLGNFNVQTFLPMIYACTALFIIGTSAVAYGSLSTKRTIPMVYVGKLQNKQGPGKIVNYINNGYSCGNKLDTQKKYLKSNYAKVDSRQNQAMRVGQFWGCKNRCLFGRKLFV